MAGSSDFLSAGLEYVEAHQYAEAIANFAAAGLQGNAEAFVCIAQVLEDRLHCADGHLLTYFRERYRRALEEAADQGDHFAARRLAALYEFGQLGLPADLLSFT